MSECVICGAVFEEKMRAHGTKYCSEECRREGVRRYNRAYYLSRRERKVAGEGTVVAGEGRDGEESGDLPDFGGEGMV